MIRLTKLALRRPVTIILCLITIAYFGLQSVMGMKLELTPEMEMPMLIIATVYPGASPEDVTDLVTKKEEDAITSLDSVDKVPFPVKMYRSSLSSMSTAPTWIPHTLT